MVDLFSYICSLATKQCIFKRNLEHTLIHSTEYSQEICFKHHCVGKNEVQSRFKTICNDDAGPFLIRHVSTLLFLFYLNLIGTCLAKHELLLNFCSLSSSTPDNNDEDDFDDDDDPFGAPSGRLPMPCRSGTLFLRGRCIRFSKK